MERSRPTMNPVVISLAAELKLDDGGELWASVDPADVTVYSP
jgi:hypothetical protein